MVVNPAPSYLRFNKVKKQGGGCRGDVHPPTLKYKYMIYGQFFKIN